MDAFVRDIPKAELHLHIEGTLEPELMFEIARRNGVPLRFRSVDEVRAAYRFTDLQSFLDIYYEGAKVLLHERDFYEMTWAYLTRAHAQHVRHVEMFFDPQTHTDRGVPFGTVVRGMRRALEDAREAYDLSSHLIMCFLRHLSADAAMATLDAAMPFKDWITAVGLDSSEVGHPPEKFRAVFDRARADGFLTVAHAGEEGPPDYVWQALDLLKVRRVDHGVRCVEDPKLVDRLREEAIALTVCPLSNVKLRVFDRLEDHNLPRLLDLGLRATVNSDDPAYFGGYIGENLQAVHHGLRLGRDDCYELSRNAFDASFLDEVRRAQLLQELDAFMRGA